MNQPLLPQTPELYAIENDAAPGYQWYAVYDPYVALLAPESKLKRSAKTKREINAERRADRALKQKSPYLQVSLSQNKAYQAKLKAILK